MNELNEWKRAVREHYGLVERRKDYETSLGRLATFMDPVDFQKLKAGIEARPRHGWAVDAEIAVALVQLGLTTDDILTTGLTQARRLCDSGDLTAHGAAECVGTLALLGAAALTQAAFLTMRIRAIE